MGSGHTIKSIQRIPADLETVWAFFSNPDNLLTITPPFLNMKVISAPYEGEIHEGQIISYKVKPIFGMSVLWMTKIKQVERFSFFIDEQLRGPYKLWHHEHYFKEIEDGVEMTDLIHYRVPFGGLGKIVEKIIVRDQLKKIFMYRYDKVQVLFGKWKDDEMDLRIE